MYNYFVLETTGKFMPKIKSTINKVYYKSADTIKQCNHAHIMFIIFIYLNIEMYERLSEKKDIEILAQGMKQCLHTTDQHVEQCLHGATIQHAKELRNNRCRYR